MDVRPASQLVDSYEFTSLEAKTSWVALRLVFMVDSLKPDQTRIGS